MTQYSVHKLPPGQAFLSTIFYAVVVHNPEWARDRVIDMIPETSMKLSNRTAPDVAAVFQDSANQMPVTKTGETGWRIDYTRDMSDGKTEITPMYYPGLRGEESFFQYFNDTLCWRSRVGLHLDRKRTSLSPAQELLVLEKIKSDQDAHENESNQTAMMTLTV